MSNFNKEAAITKAGFILEPTYQSSVSAGGTLSWEVDPSRFRQATSLTSPIYEIRDMKWQMTLKPNFVDEHGTRYLSFWLKLLDSASDNVCCNFVMSAKVENEGCIMNVSGLKWFTKDKCCAGYLKFCPMYCIPEGKGTVIFETVVIVIGGSCENKKKPGQVEDKKNKVEIKEVEVMDDDEELELDAVITTGLHKFSVSSKRFSRHSEAFRQFLANKTEKTDDAFDVSPICSSKTIMEKIIGYCHTGKLNIRKSVSAEMITTLFEIAVTLEMPYLRNTVEHFLLTNLSPETFVTAVRQATSGMLSQNAHPIILKYLLSNYDDIRHRPEFKETFEIFFEYYKEVLIPARYENPEN